MATSPRLRVLYRCKCGKAFRPFHRNQQSCSKACGYIGRKFKPPSALAREKAAAAMRLKSWRRTQEAIAACATKEEAFAAGHKLGWQRGVNRAYRRGYSVGYSAAIGETKRSA